jgi:hypothetical protein
VEGSALGVICGMTNYIFWDVTHFSPVDVHLRFGGRYCFCLQGGRCGEQTTSKKIETIHDITSQRSENFKCYIFLSIITAFAWGD